MDNEIMEELNKKNQLIIFNLTTDPYNLKNFGMKNECLLNNSLINDIFNIIEKENHTVVLQSYYGNQYISEYYRNDEFKYRYVIIKSFQNNYSDLKDVLHEKTNKLDENNKKELLNYIHNNLKHWYLDGILLEDYQDPQNKISYFLFWHNRPATETYCHNLIDELEKKLIK